MFCACRCLCTVAIPGGAGRSNELEFCITGRNRMCQPYMESATTLSDYEEQQEFPFFCRAAERHFQSLAGPSNESVDLKYDVLCL